MAQNITKDRTLHIYLTIIQSILDYGAEVRPSPTTEINRILSTELNVLRRSAGKSRMERIKNEHIKEIMGVKGKPDIIDIIQGVLIKSLARPGRKQATATEEFDVHISYLLS